MRTSQYVVPVFDNVATAESAMHSLQQSGFDHERLSVVANHIDPNSDVGQELNYEDESIRDAAFGATLGGIAAVLGDAAIFVIGGIGAVIFSSPIMAAAGVMAGAFLGAMAGWEVLGSQIRKYEGLVQDSKVLLAVDGDPQQVADAEGLLRGSSATEIHFHAVREDGTTDRCH